MPAPYLHARVRATLPSRAMPASRSIRTRQSALRGGSASSSRIVLRVVSAAEATSRSSQSTSSSPMRFRLFRPSLPPSARHRPLRAACPKRRPPPSARARTPCPVLQPRSARRSRTRRRLRRGRAARVVPPGPPPLPPMRSLSAPSRHYSSLLLRPRLLQSDNSRLDRLVRRQTHSPCLPCSLHDSDSARLPRCISPTSSLSRQPRLRPRRPVQRSLLALGQSMPLRLSPRASSPSRSLPHPRPSVTRGSSPIPLSRSRLRPRLRDVTRCTRRLHHSPPLGTA